MISTACQNGLEIALAALVIETGPSSKSLSVVRFGIRRAKEILDKASLFHVQSLSACISLGNHASFRLSQKFWRFGIASPPWDWGCCAASWLITTFFGALFPYEVVQHSLKLQDKCGGRIRNYLDQVSYFT